MSLRTVVAAGWSAEAAAKCALIARRRQLRPVPLQQQPNERENYLHSHREQQKHKETRVRVSP